MKKRKHRRIKYRTIAFKLSPGQYRSLMNYCKALKTTPIKLIKCNIERFINNYEYEVLNKPHFDEKQLELFEDI